MIEGGSAFLMQFLFPFVFVHIRANGRRRKERKKAFRRHANMKDIDSRGKKGREGKENGWMDGKIPRRISSCISGWPLLC